MNNLHLLPVHQNYYCSHYLSENKIQETKLWLTNKGSRIRNLPRKIQNKTSPQNKGECAFPNSKPTSNVTNRTLTNESLEKETTKRYILDQRDVVGREKKIKESLYVSHDIPLN